MENLDAFEILKEMTEPEEPRSGLGEVGAGLLGGTVGVLPSMVGKTAQSMSIPGADVYEWGKDVSNKAEARLEQEKYKLHPDQHGTIINAAAAGAQSIPAMGATAAITAINTPAGLAAASILYGGSGYTDAYNETLSKTGNEAKAQRAGLEAGFWQGGLGVIEQRIFGKFFKAASSTVGGKTVSEALGKIKNPKAVTKYFQEAKNTLIKETAVENVQDTMTKQAVTRQTGEDLDPWEVIKGTTPPTVAATIMLLPFGIPAHISQARKNKDTLATIEDSNAAPEDRIKAAIDIFGQLEEINPVDANVWSAATMTAIAENRDIDIRNPSEITRTKEKQEPHEEDTIDTTEAQVEENTTGTTKAQVEADDYESRRQQVWLDRAQALFNQSRQKDSQFGDEIPYAPVPALRPEGLLGKSIERVVPTVKNATPVQPETIDAEWRNVPYQLGGNARLGIEYDQAHSPRALGNKIVSRGGESIPVGMSPEQFIDTGQVITNTNITTPSDGVITPEQRTAGFNEAEAPAVASKELDPLAQGMHETTGLLEAEIEQNKFKIAQQLYRAKQQANIASVGKPVGVPMSDQLGTFAPETIQTNKEQVVPETATQEKPKKYIPIMKRKEFRELLPIYMDQVQSGSEMGLGTVYDTDERGHFGKRTPSTNPPWAQEAIRMAGTVKKLRKAVDKAVNGEPLGKNQRIAVEVVTDAISSDRVQYQLPDAEERLRNTRIYNRSVKEAKDKPSSELMEMDEHETVLYEDFDEETKNLYDLTKQAYEATDENTVNALLESDRTDGEIATELYKIIEGETDGRQGEISETVERPTETTQGAEEGSAGQNWAESREGDLRQEVRQDKKPAQSKIDTKNDIDLFSNEAAKPKESKPKPEQGELLAATPKFGQTKKRTMSDESTPLEQAVDEADYLNKKEDFTKADAALSQKAKSPSRNEQQQDREGSLRNLNQTGEVFADHSPTTRMKAPLGEEYIYRPNAHKEKTSTTLLSRNKKGKIDAKKKQGIDFGAEESLSVLEKDEHQAIFGDSSPKVINGGKQGANLRALGQQLGYNVFILAGEGSGRFNGFTVQGRKDVFVFETTEELPLVVVGHEITHLMQEENTPLYVEMVESLLAIKNDKVFDAYSRKNAFPDEDFSEFVDEWVADVVGQSMNSPKFWNAFANQNPTVAKKVAQFIQKLIGKISNTARDMFPSISEVERITGEALGQFVSQKNTRNKQQQGMGKSEVESLLHGIVKTWKTKPSIVVVETEADLPNEIRKAMSEQDADGQVRGVYHNGRAYIVAGNIANASVAEETLLHEAIGHHGLRNMFGKDFNSAMNSLFIKIGGLAGLRKMADRFDIDLSDYEAGLKDSKLRKETVNRILMEELLAHMAQNNIQPTVIQKIMGVIRSTLRRLGLKNLETYNDTDLINLVSRAQKEMIGDVANGGVRFSRGMRKVGEGEATLSVEETRNLGMLLTATIQDGKLKISGIGASHYNVEQPLRNQTDLQNATGFVTPDGDFLNRKEALTWLKEERPDTYAALSRETKKNGLESQDYANAEGVHGDVDVEMNKFMERQFGTTDAVLFSRTAENELIAEEQKKEETRISKAYHEASPRIKKATDQFRKYISNQYVAVENVMKHLQDKYDWVVNDDNNVRKKLKLLPSRTQYRLKHFSSNEVQDYYTALEKSELTNDEVETYLYATFALNGGNARIAAINEEMQDGGTGMTNADAEAYLEEFDNEGKTEELEELANIVYKITEKQRNIIREAGLEKEETIDGWDDNPYYMPMKGGKDIDEGMGTGTGVNVRRSGTMTALGRRSRATDLISHLVKDTSAVIVRAEKVEVARAVDRMALENPEFEGLKVYDPANRSSMPTKLALQNNNDVKRIKRKISTIRHKLTGNISDTRKDNLNANLIQLEGELAFTKDKIVMSVLDMAGINSDSVLTVTRENGSVVYVHMEDDNLAKAITKQGIHQTGKIIQSFAKTTRFLSQMSTTKNPAFMFANFPRDLQSAMVHLTSDHSKEIAKTVLKSIPSMMKGIHSALRGDGTHEMATWYDRADKAGGLVSFMDLKTVEDWQKELSKVGKRPNATKRNIKKLGDMIEDYNTIVESAVRVATFKALVESGYSESDAAVASKDVTIDFNEHGELGPAINAFYMFANAGIQDMERIAKAFKNNPKAMQKIVAGIAVTGFMIAEANRLAAGDDEDGEARWDKLSEFTKMSNYVMLDADGNEYKVRTPYGYNTFVALGYALNDVAHWAAGNGGKSPTEAAAFLTKSLMNSYNPLGGNDSLMKIITPTLIDPLYEIEMNENFMGTSIRPENLPWEDKPDSQLYFRSVSKPSKFVTEKMNLLTGGDKYDAGLIDVSPETLDHWAEFILGGAGRTVLRTVGMGSKIADGDLQTRDVPVARQFFSESTPYADFDRFYDNIQQVTLTRNAIKDMPQDEREDYKQKHGEYRLKNAAKLYKKGMQKLRRKRRNHLDAGRKQDAKRVQEKMQKLALKFNKLYNSKTG